MTKYFCPKTLISVKIWHKKFQTCCMLKIYTHADRICLKWNVQGAKKASPRHSPVTTYPPLFPQLPSVYFEKLFSGKVLIKYKNAYLHNCNSIKGMDFSQKLMSTTRKIKVIFLKWRKTNKLWRYGRSSQKTVRFMV